jgi:hypothetical protein
MRLVATVLSFHFDVNEATGLTPTKLRDTTTPLRQLPLRTLHETNN